MSEDNNQRSERILKEFERHLPALWERARTNEEQAKSEYSLKVLSKLLKQVNVSSFEECFVGYNSQEIMNKLVIVVEDELKMLIEWVESRYSSLLRSSLKTVVRVKIDLQEITNKDKYPEPFEESEIINFLKVNEEKIEKESELHEKRKQLNDYKDGLVNLSKCLCGCIGTPNTLIELKFPDQQSILGITVEGATCRLCEERYFLMSTIKSIGIIGEVLLQSASQNNA